jgi:hypothetical protein
MSQETQLVQNRNNASSYEKTRQYTNDDIPRFKALSMGFVC